LCAPPSGEAAGFPVEGLNDARAKLTAFLNSLLVNVVWGRTSVQDGLNILQADQSHLNPRV
jgi:hypothetical protein